MPFLELTQAVLSGWEPAERGPYTQPVARLLRECAAPARRWLDQYGAVDAYAAATGVTLSPELVELYRLGWDIRDLAYDVARFLRPHGADANDAESWALLSALIRRAGS